MMNFLTYFAFVLVLINQAYGQNEPVPEYMMTQRFPDSVLKLEMLNRDGESLSFNTVLDSRKGKKIVIDFWASWCSDCIRGLPKLKTVQGKTDNDKVDYVFISLDKDDKRWNKAIEKYEIQGDHFRVTSGWKNALTNYINLDWIPRYVILSETGDVILPKAISASDKEFKKILIHKN